MTKATFPTFTPPAPDTIPSGGGNPSLANRFLAVPFSLLEARTGWWRDRNAAWPKPYLAGRDQSWRLAQREAEAIRA